PAQPPGPAAAHLPGIFGNKRGRLILLVSLLAGAAILYGATAYYTTKRPGRTMTDPTFERGADAICARTLPKLRAVRDKNPPDQTSKKALNALADKVDDVSTKLTAFVAEVRTVPVQPQNKAQVDAWLHQWDVYITIGHRYADAVRTGNDKAYSAVAKQGVAPVKAIGKFARGNHIDACVP
ncbi:MAG: hypothetical protein JO087_06415, partial [Actinobacteria bacterium]|nr:hypothetical protein [Actinomycetota bacterium]